jgi:hypothetical protein
VSFTIKIGQNERDTLHWLMCRRLFILGQDPPGLARKEGVGTDELAEEFGEDLRLMDDLGWEVEGERGPIALTMPADSLARTLKRLRRDARRAPCEERHELEAKDSDPERWERFRQAVDTCEELLDLLDSPHREEDEEPGSAACPLATAAQDLKPYTPVTDGLVLAALERAELHEREDEVLTYVLSEHLGFEPIPSTNRLLFPRLEGLRRAGLLTTAERRGEPFWSLTSVGRERLANDREAGDGGELPESPQHRAWRHARVKAAVRIEEFRRAQVEAAEEADRLINQYRPAMSAEWFELSERLRWAAWRLASAIYCLNEWVEPDDDSPDVDENPGPSPGRRTTSAWDQSSTES